MPAILASAPGKIILVGEHAVVYDRPAIAIPVFQVQAKATISADPAAPTGQVLLDAPEIGLKTSLAELPSDHPLAIAFQGVSETLGLTHLPAIRLRISSTIPVAAGLGSGAAVSVAVIRALSAFLGRPLPDEQVSALAYRVEQRLHGTPSGIDNTVITYVRPVFFQRSLGFQRLQIERPLTFVIGDTGRRASTAITVGDVHQRWQQDPTSCEGIFDRIGSLVLQARAALESGLPASLGPLMDENQEYLRSLDVSSPELDRLVEAARSAGALGAKLSGGGRGGNMIALSNPEQAETIAAALQEAGAVRTIITHLPKTSG